jgi:clan AA aspartic protease (TIGR02281 family)
MNKRENRVLKTVGKFGYATLCAFAALSLFGNAAYADPYADGIEFYQQRNYQRAASCFETALVRSNENTNAMYYAALSYQQLRNNAKAVELYGKLAKRYPTSRAGVLAIQALRGLGLSGGASGGSTSSASSSVRSYSRSSGSGGGEDPDIARLPSQDRLHFRTEEGGGKPVLFVSGAVNSTPLDFVFDTGCDQTVIGMDTLAKIGLPKPSGPPSGRSMGVGNAITDNWTLNVTVRVGGIERRNFPLLVSDRSGVPPLLGRNFMEPYNYTIDTSGGSILMTKKVTAVASGGYSTTSQGGVPFRRIRGGGVLVNVEVNGRSIAMLFDTGAQSCLFSRADINKLGITVPADAQPEMTQGVGGSMPGLRFPVSRMRLGPIDKSNLSITVVEQDFGEPLLGQAFFHDYQYTIDDQNSVIRFLRR